MGAFSIQVSHYTKCFSIYKKHFVFLIALAAIVSGAVLFSPAARGVEVGGDVPTGGDFCTSPCPIGGGGWGEILCANPGGGGWYATGGDINDPNACGGSPIIGFDVNPIDSGFCGDGICSSEEGPYCSADCGSGPLATDGICGSADGASYPFGTTTWPSGNAGFCTQGIKSLNGSTLAASIPFPAAGTTRSWYCLGSNGGANATCSASRQNGSTTSNYQCNPVSGICEVCPSNQSCQSLDSCLSSCTASTPVCTIDPTITGPSAGSVGQSLTFTGAANASNCSGSPTYSWNLGDGTNGANSPVVTKSYAFANNYLINLTVTQGGQTRSITKTVTISNSAVNGQCGAAANVYNSSQTTFSGSFCNSGTASPANPAFPIIGGSVSWVCQGGNGGSNESCTATRSSASDTTPPSVTADPKNAATTGSVTVNLYATDSGGLDTNNMRWHIFTSAGADTGIAGNFTAGRGSNAQAAVNISQLGSYKIHYYVKDRSGNLSEGDFAPYTLSNAIIPVNGQCGNAAKSYSNIDTTFSGSLCNTGTANPSAPAFPAAGGSASWTCQGASGGTDQTCNATRAAVATPSSWSGNLYNSAFGQDMGWVLFGNPAGTSYDGLYTGIKINTDPIVAGGSQYRVSGNAYSSNFGLLNLDATTVDIITPSRKWAVLRGTGRFASGNIPLVTASGIIDDTLCDNYKNNIAGWPASPVTDSFGVCIDLSGTAGGDPKIYGFAWSDAYGWLKFAGNEMSVPPVNDRPVSGVNYQMTTSWGANSNMNNSNQNSANQNSNQNNGNQNNNSNTNANPNTPVITIVSTDHPEALTGTWIKGSANAVINCSTTSGSCTSSSLQFSVSTSNPGTCQGQTYSIPSPLIVTNHLWLCATGSYTSGGGTTYTGYSQPTEFLVDNTPPDCASNAPASGQYYAQIELPPTTCTDADSGTTTVVLGYGETYSNPVTKDNFPKAKCSSGTINGRESSQSTGEKKNCFETISSNIKLPSDNYEAERYENSFAFKATDRVGNEAFVPVRYSIYLIAPVVQYSEYVSGSNNLNLYGNNFGTEGKVHFYNEDKVEIGSASTYANSDGKQLSSSITSTLAGRTDVRYLRVQRGRGDTFRDSEISSYHLFNFQGNGLGNLSLLPSHITALPSDTVTFIASVGPDTPNHILKWKIPDPDDITKNLLDSTTPASKKITDSVPPSGLGNNVFTIKLKPDLDTREYSLMVEDLTPPPSPLSAQNPVQLRMVGALYNDTVTGSEAKRLALVSNRDLGGYGTTELTPGSVGDLNITGSNGGQQTYYQQSRSTTGGDGGISTNPPVTQEYITQNNFVQLNDGSGRLVNPDTGEVLTPLSKTSTTGTVGDEGTTGVVGARINGTCGPSNNTPLTSAPVSGLCTSGTATPVQFIASSNQPGWGWTCAGLEGGLNASCFAPQLVNTGGSNNLNQNISQNINTNNRTSQNINQNSPSQNANTGSNPGGITNTNQSNNNGTLGRDQNTNSSEGGSNNVNTNLNSNTQQNQNTSGPQQNTNQNNSTTQPPAQVVFPKATAILTIINPNSSDSSRYMFCYNLACNSIINLDHDNSVLSSIANRTSSKVSQTIDGKTQEQKVISLDGGLELSQRSVSSSEGDSAGIILDDFSDIYLGTEEAVSFVSVEVEGSDDLQTTITIEGDKNGNNNQSVSFSGQSSRGINAFGDIVAFTGYTAKPVINLQQGTLYRVKIHLLPSSESTNLAIDSSLLPSQNQCNYVSTGYCYQLCYTTPENNGTITAHVRGNCPVTSSDAGPIQVREGQPCNPNDTSEAGRQSCAKIEQYCTDMCVRN